VAAGDSLYRRRDPARNWVYKRFDYDQAGLAHQDAEGSWRYLGSYYTFKAHARTSRRVLHKEYRGPMFEDPRGSGRYLLHHRYVPTPRAPEASLSRDFVHVPLTTPKRAYPEHTSVGQMLNRMNDSSNGGIVMRGQDYSWVTHDSGSLPSLKAAEEHLRLRARSDPSCRSRSLITISVVPSVSVLSSLYNAVPDNPMPSFILGPPAWHPSDFWREHLDRHADLVDDGLPNKSSRAYHPRDGDELEQNLREVLGKKIIQRSIGGDYATAPASAGTAPGSATADGVAYVASFEYPGWRGHLRALDLTRPAGDPARVRWDAGQRLRSSGWRQRKIYTTSPTGWDPTRFFDAGGTVDVAAVRRAWPSTSTPPDDEQLHAMVRWLAGADRDWKLGPILYTVPAVVGPPASLPGLAGHEKLENEQRSRRTLVYAASNDGLLHAFDAATGYEVFAYLPHFLLPEVYALYKQGGQDPDPNKLRYLLARSPRVEDLLVKGSWRTHLVQPSGPGGDDFFVLDITDPSGEPPFAVAFVSADVMKGETLGQSWSVPALFWDASRRPRMAMGSGYDDPEGTPGEGSYYNYWDQLWFPKVETHHLSGSGARVPYAVLADTAAVVSAAGDRRVVATYQADLAGRVTRFGEGKASEPRVVLDAGVEHPFYHAPAVVLVGDRVTLAAASGSYLADGAPATPRLYLRTERGGAVDDSASFTCAVDRLCQRSCYNGAAAPACTTSPGPKARPVGSPLLVHDPTSGAVEAFWALREPMGCSERSWVIRVATRQGKHRLVEAKALDGVRVSGLTLVGGGSEVALTVSSRGDGKQGADVLTLGGKPLGGAARQGGGVVVESWREVR
jgi:hypothetical protein